MSKRITCINKNDRYNPYERITHVGVLSGNATTKYTQKEIIVSIEKGESYVVIEGGKSAKVEVGTSPYGNKYIKTIADNDEPNNLLSLKECVG